MKKVVLVLILVGAALGQDTQWWLDRQERWFEEQQRQSQEDMRFWDEQWRNDQRNDRLADAIKKPGRRRLSPQPEVIIPPPSVEFSRLKSQMRRHESRIAKLERAVRVLQKRYEPGDRYNRKMERN